MNHFSNDVSVAKATEDPLGDVGRSSATPSSNQSDWSIIEQASSLAERLAPYADLRGLLTRRERIAEREALRIWQTVVLCRNAHASNIDFTPGKITILDTDATRQANPFGDPQSNFDLEQLFQGM
ncbi:hypothetical protein BH10CYA1_BH10CYA1_32650 [soil metagenome]